MINALRHRNIVVLFVGGSLLLADKGVCVVRNLQSFKKDTRTKLQRGEYMGLGRYF